LSLALPYGKFLRMTLTEYLSTHKLTPADFAGRMGKPVSTVTRLLNGERKPGSELLQAIVDATAGEVLPNDFFNLPPQPKRGAAWPEDIERPAAQGDGEAA
jgi:transcriptional regulator with XRE-family HTH domain